MLFRCVCVCACFTYTSAFVVVFLASCIVFVVVVIVGVLSCVIVLLCFRLDSGSVLWCIVVSCFLGEGAGTRKVHAHHPALSHEPICVMHGPCCAL